MSEFELQRLPRPQGHFVSIHPGRVDNFDVANGIHVTESIWSHLLTQIMRSRISDYCFHANTEASRSEWLEVVHDLDVMRTRVRSCEYLSELQVEMSWVWSGTPFKDEKQFQAKKQEFFGFFDDLHAWLDHALQHHDYLTICGM